MTLYSNIMSHCDSQIKEARNIQLPLCSMWNITDHHSSYCGQTLHLDVPLRRTGLLVEMDS